MQVWLQIVVTDIEECFEALKDNLGSNLPPTCQLRMLSDSAPSLHLGSDNCKGGTCLRVCYNTKLQWHVQGILFKVMDSGFSLSKVLDPMKPEYCLLLLIRAQEAVHIC